LKNRSIRIFITGEVDERVGFGEHPDRIDFWPLGKHVLASAFLNKTWRSDTSYVGGVFGSRTRINQAALVIVAVTPFRLEAIRLPSVIAPACCSTRCFYRGVHLHLDSALSRTGKFRDILQKSINCRRSIKALLETCSGCKHPYKTKCSRREGASVKAKIPRSGGRDQCGAPSTAENFVLAISPLFLSLRTNTN